MKASPFETHPEFVEQDNRKERTLSPVTREQLENKHAAMFAEWNLEGKSVLDLGCALGATGHWVLSFGAASYTGVEVQKEYADKARDLLAFHGGKAKVVHSSLEDFFAGNSEHFDVVLLLGVIYAFLDQYKILREVTSVCREVLIVEGLYPRPEIYRKWPAVIELSDKHHMVRADTAASVIGTGARSSPEALDIMLGSLGFEETGPLIKPKQIKGSLDIFSGDPTRVYGVRYIRAYRNTGHLNRELTRILASGELGAAPSYSWKEHEDKRKYFDPALPPITERQWEFDEKVAKSFEQEARTNIPDYDRVIDLSIDLCGEFFASDARIIDVGSALGETLRRFQERGYTNLVGIDSSRAMIEQAYQSETSPIQYICSEIYPEEATPCDFVTANWVLHFIPNRRDYLAAIYRSLRPGGALVLTEKLLASEVVAARYRQFKRDQGLSGEYIVYKEEAIKEVLVPFPLEWYLLALREVGFRRVETVNARLAFTTFLAVK